MQMQMQDKQLKKSGSCPVLSENKMNKQRQKAFSLPVKISTTQSNDIEITNLTPENGKMRKVQPFITTSNLDGKSAGDSNKDNFKYQNISRSIEKQGWIILSIKVLFKWLIF